MARSLLVVLGAAALGAEALLGGGVASPSTRGTLPSQVARTRAVLTMGYVPDGLTPQQYAAMKKNEGDAQKKKNFGMGGARGFQSRSMASFIMAKERGETDFHFPVNPAKVKSGEIPLKDVPYMQRGGSWDNSDLIGKKGWMQTGFGMTAFNDGKAKKKEWNKFDKMQNNLKPSVGIFGSAGAVDWTGRGARGGDGKTAGGTVAARAAKNGISTDAQMWRDSGALSKSEIEKMNRGRGSGAPKIGVKGQQPEAKKFFGLF